MSPSMSPAAAEWHVSGEHGISSEAIFDQLIFGRRSARWYSDYPHDPSDFRRCELLLRAVPELRPRLSEMVVAGPVWAALVARWDEIAALFEEEIPGVFEGAHGTAGRTYALMDLIITAARGVGRWPADAPTPASGAATAPDSPGTGTDATGTGSGGPGTR